MNPVPYCPREARLQKEGTERTEGLCPQHYHYAMLFVWLMLQAFGLLPVLLWIGPRSSYLAIFPSVILIVSGVVCLLTNATIGRTVCHRWPREGPCWHPLVMILTGGLTGMAVAFIVQLLYLIAGQGFGDDMWLVGIGAPLAAGALAGAMWAWLVWFLDRRWLERTARWQREAALYPAGPP